MIYANNEIYHHGVKGQKWGIRRYQPYPKGKHGKFLGQDRDNDIKIDKGTDVYRVQQKGQFHTKEPGRRMYVTLDKMDAFNYASASAGLDGAGLHVEMVNHDTGEIATMKLNKNVIIPSYEKVMDAFIKSFDGLKVKDAAKEMYKADEPGIDKGEKVYRNKLAKEFLNEVKNIEKDDALDKAYILFVGTFMDDSKAKRAFFKNLSDQGYNAIIDDFDVKFGSDNKRQNFIESIILFNNNDVSFHKALPISDKDAKYLSDIWRNGARDKTVRRRNKESARKFDKWVGYPIS